MIRVGDPQFARVIRTGDPQFEQTATELIKVARTAGDTLGGIFEVIAYGLPIGLGTYGQWDERLDGRLAAAVMSIQSIKGVELGDAFGNASRYGSQAHDVIDYDPAHSWSRPTNRAGGLEGGITNGMPLIVRGADTNQKELTPESRGLEAIAEGFRLVYRDDHQQLAQELAVYDALYAYCEQRVASAQINPPAVDERLFDIRRKIERIAVGHDQCRGFGDFE